MLNLMVDDVSVAKLGRIHCSEITIIDMDGPGIFEWSEIDVQKAKSTDSKVPLLIERNKVCVQHTATHCNTLHHTATHCNTLQHTATHCTTRQHTATHARAAETVYVSIELKKLYLINQICSDSIMSQKIGQENCPILRSKDFNSDLLREWIEWNTLYISKVSSAAIL